MNFLIFLITNLIKLQYDLFVAFIIHNQVQIVSVIFQCSFFSILNDLVFHHWPRFLTYFPVFIYSSLNGLVFHQWPRFLNYFPLFIFFFSYWPCFSLVTSLLSGLGGTYGSGMPTAGQMGGAYMGSSLANLRLRAHEYSLHQGQVWSALETRVRIRKW